MQKRIITSMENLQKYCSTCGTKLTLKYMKDEGDVPYCETCQDYRFEMFNSAVSTVIFNPDKTKVLLIQQYGRDWNILVAGYINKGETAYEALHREVKEEVNLTLSSYLYNIDFYFERSNSLIHNFISIATSEDFTIKEDEVDYAQWYSIEEAKKAIKQESLASYFLNLALQKIGDIT